MNCPTDSVALTLMHIPVNSGTDSKVTAVVKASWSTVISCRNNDIILYYNGTVFRGFLSGICESVLAGGRYDRLLTRMGRKAGAIGFAIYLDLLEALDRNRSELDADVLLLYSEETANEAAKEVEKLIALGKSVSAQKAIPPKFRYGELVDVRKEAKDA